MILLNCRDPRRQSIPGEARQGLLARQQGRLMTVYSARQTGEGAEGIALQIRMLMNATIEMLRRRRSLPPQGMTGPGPNAQEIDTLLRLASRVPDHGKLAPWRFLI